MTLSEPGLPYVEGEKTSHLAFTIPGADLASQPTRGASRQWFLSVSAQHRVEDTVSQQSLWCCSLSDLFAKSFPTLRKPGCFEFS